MADRKRQYLLLADEDLISLLVEGDARAFATLYDRHGRAAYSLAYRMMGEKQAAEDLVQDALLKVWRGAESYRAERGSARTWILSIVHNRGIDQLRSLASRRRTQDRVEASAPTSQPSEAFAETWRNSQREQVREALSTLPPEQVKILELAYFSGYTHVEIAELLGLPLGTVKGRMRLGLKKIRDYFDGRSLTSESKVRRQGTCQLSRACGCVASGKVTEGFQGTQQSEGAGSEVPDLEQKPLRRCARVAG